MEDNPQELHHCNEHIDMSIEEFDNEPAQHKKQIFIKIL